MTSRVSPAIEGLVYAAAVKLAKCTHPGYAVESSTEVKTCANCGSVWMRDIGWTRPVLLNSIAAVLEAVVEYEQEKTEQGKPAPAP